MKKIEKSQSKVLPSVRLFRDDLDQAAEMLRETCEKVVFIYSDYEFESLEELAQKVGSRISSLEIKGVGPYVSLHLKRDFPAVFLYCSEGKESQTIFLRLKDFLMSKVKWQTYVFSPSVGIISLVLFIVSLIAISQNSVRSVITNPYVRLFPLIFLFVALASAVYRSGIAYTIILEARHQRLSFFSRKKDDIIMLILGAIIGTIITAVVAHWISR